MGKSRSITHECDSGGHCSFFRTFVFDSLGRILDAMLGDEINGIGEIIKEANAGVQSLRKNRLRKRGRKRCSGCYDAGTAG